MTHILTLRKCVFCLGLLIPALFSCKGDSAKTLPKDIISEDKMKQIYTDVFIAEAATAELHLPPDSNKKLMQIRYTQIAVKYKVSRKNLIKSLIYYPTNTEVFSKTMQTVIDSLRTMEVRLEHSK